MRCTDRVQHEAAPEMPLERAVRAAMRSCVHVLRLCGGGAPAAVISWRPSLGGSHRYRLSEMPTPKIYRARMPGSAFSGGRRTAAFINPLRDERFLFLLHTACEAAADKPPNKGHRSQWPG